MEIHVPKWVGDGVSNTPNPIKEPTPKKEKTPHRITLQRVKSEWANCCIVDEFDPEMVDWLIARVETLELRLAKHRGSK